MPVTSIFWPDNSAQDLHLVPGYTGPRLDHLLWIANTGGNARADAPPAGVVVAFAANFVAGPATAGIAVSATGEVTVTAPLHAPPRLLDFLVVATATEGANVFTAYKRFRIHGAIAKMWLTPSTLTVRQGARGMRPTIVAKFDDGTYGDLTNWSPWDSPAAADRTFVRKNGSVAPAVTWTSATPANVAIHGTTGLLNAVAAAGNSALTAALQPAAPATTAAGTARAAPGWTTPVRLTPLAGPGFAAMATTPNVLILPDGFVAAEKAAHEKIARDLVKKLNVRLLTRPYDLLAAKMNFFSAWVESRESGISPLPEVRRTSLAGTDADATEVDTSIAAAAVANAWTVGAPPTAATNDRFLVNERDTAFQAALGERPRAQRFLALRDVVLNASRFSEDDFDAFLGALQDAAGNAVGTVWTRGKKDEDLIVLLCHSNRNGGSNAYRSPSGRIVCMTLDRADHHRIRDSGGTGQDLLPDPIPGEANLEIWTTAAHEIAHSFSLKDEYGGGGKLPASSVADLTAKGNVDARVNLLTGGSLDPVKIKWQWPRLRKAGVLTAAPVAAGAEYQVTLQAGQAAAFAQDDVVRFRKRPLVGAPAASDRFKVTAAPAGDVVTVKPLTAAAFVPATYPAGSVLICPRRATDPNPAAGSYGDDLPLVHAGTTARIAATHNPLNAKDGDPANRPCPGAALPTPTPATNFPGGKAPDPPKYSSWIVGLYENGASYDCDVYRPTGVCLMRTLHYLDKPAKTESSYQFCPVCRYVMVDRLDPTQHGKIDDDYAPRYPT